MAGPTAVGKTSLCIRLAQHFNTEILSADSRQFYLEMNIGTAKPTPAEQQGIVHHFINTRHITEPYTVANYEKDALTTLNGIFEKKEIAILTGGSGLFVKAVCEGLDEMPEIPPEIRQNLQQQLDSQGLAVLFDQLTQLDPVYAAQVDSQNPQRIMRALEVCLSSGVPYSSFRTGKITDRPFEIHKIGLNRPRPELYDRIDRRMEEMLQNGLVAEARNLYAYKDMNALQTVGYQEVFGYLDGLYDHAEMVRLLKRNSRRYAKRQLTWFHRDPAIHWFHPDDWNDILSLLSATLIS